MFPLPWEDAAAGDGDDDAGSGGDLAPWAPEEGGEGDSIAAVTAAALFRVLTANTGAEEGGEPSAEPVEGSADAAVLRRVLTRELPPPLARQASCRSRSSAGDGLERSQSLSEAF